MRTYPHSPLIYEIATDNILFVVIGRVTLKFFVFINSYTTKIFIYDLRTSNDLFSLALVNT